MDTDFKYFAFISYSRKDSRAAMYLHRKLESFKIPIKHIPEEMRSGLNKFLRPIFRDKRDLEVGESSFAEDVKKALAASRFIIIVLSTNSAKSVWVNKEIEYFLSTHGYDLSKVVPVVLSGNVGSGNGETECLCECLLSEEIKPVIVKRNLPTMVPDEGEPEKSGWESGVVGVLSYMLKIKRADVKAAIDAERIRFLRIKTIVGACFAGVFAILSLWAIKAERLAAYNQRIADKNALEAERQADIATQKAKDAKQQAELANSNAEKAKYERRLATEALDFMMGTFRQSDPLNAGQYDVRMIDILKARIPDIAKLEPWELRADIGCQIGSLLHNVGLFEEATNLLFSTVALNLNKRPQSPATAFSLYCASWCLKDMLDMPLALSYAKKALDIYENAPEPEQQKIALVCNAIGVFYMNCEGDVENARRYLNRAYEIRLKELGGDHVDLAPILCNLGFMYAKKNAFESAVKAYSRALKIYNCNGVEVHAGAARAWRGLGLAYYSMGDYEQAIEAFTKALDMLIMVSGRDSVGAINLYREIGLAYRRLGNYSKALDFMKSALDISLKVAQKTKGVAVLKAVKKIEREVRDCEHLKVRRLDMNGNVKSIRETANENTRIHKLRSQ